MNGLTHTVTRHPDGTIQSEHWFRDGQRHRLVGPARISYGPTGIREAETWYQDGTIYRQDGPAHSYYFPSGAVQSQAWFGEGRLHREDGPARIYYQPNGAVKAQAWWLWGERIDDADVRHALAALDPNTPAHDLIWLAHHRCAAVRRLAVRHPRIPTQIRAAAVATDPEWFSDADNPRS